MKMKTQKVKKVQENNYDAYGTLIGAGIGWMIHLLYGEGIDWRFNLIVIVFMFVGFIIGRELK